jgi:hypothetical protein
MRLHERLAATAGFVEMWRSGMGSQEMARRLGYSVSTIRRGARYLRILHQMARPTKNGGVLGEAPSDDEERLSQATLALAPSVAARAAEVKALRMYRRSHSGKDLTVGGE